MVRTDFPMRKEKTNTPRDKRPKKSPDQLLVSRGTKAISEKPIPPTKLINKFMMSQVKQVRIKNLKELPQFNLVKK
jgi:hypothetical protein